MLHMSKPSQVLREALQLALRQSCVGQRRWEKDHGLPAWSVRGLLDEDRQQCPSLDRAAEIAREVGIDFYIGERKSEKQLLVSQNADVAPDRYECLFKAQRALMDMSIALDEMYPAGIDWGEMDEDGLHDIGDGWFRVWLARRGEIPAHCGITEVKGVDMEPTLRDGAAVLVSRDHRTPGPVGVFMLRRGRHRIFRRLRREGRSWTAYGDNLDCPTMRLRASSVEHSIAGQVIFSAREHFTDAGPYLDDTERLRAQLASIARMVDLDRGNVATEFIRAQSDETLVKLARLCVARALEYGRAPDKDKELLLDHA